MCARYIFIYIFTCLFESSWPLCADCPRLVYPPRTSKCQKESELHRDCPDSWAAHSGHSLDWTLWIDSFRDWLTSGNHRQGHLNSMTRRQNWKKKNFWREGGGGGFVGNGWGQWWNEFLLATPQFSLCWPWLREVVVQFVQTSWISISAETNCMSFHQQCILEVRHVRRLRMETFVIANNCQQMLACVFSSKVVISAWCFIFLLRPKWQHWLCSFLLVCLAVFGRTVKLTSTFLSCLLSTQTPLKWWWWDILAQTPPPTVTPPRYPFICAKRFLETDLSSWTCWVCSDASSVKLINAQFSFTLVLLFIQYPGC